MDASRSDLPPIAAAEFFAGIGLVRLGLERAGVTVEFANDIEAMKQAVYAENFGDDHFLLADVATVAGSDVPDVDIATASFPCTDLSVAGYRAGLVGKQSSTFWQFARILEEMSERRPQAVMLENVHGFATSHGGADLRAAIEALNELGYSCDVITVDARLFVPQSRPRLFVIGLQNPHNNSGSSGSGPYRTRVVADFLAFHDDLLLHHAELPALEPHELGLDDCVERMPASDGRWWDRERTDRFLSSLSKVQAERLDRKVSASRLNWATAYRRTRKGTSVWEIRADNISGCLRTARGGSSRQAVVEAGRGDVRVRWMTPNEYANLQGAPGFQHDSVTPNQALFGYGDAVCVPAIEWIARHYLVPAVWAKVAG